MLARGCIECPPESPKCNTCAKNEQCILSVQSCSKCAEARCVQVGDSLKLGNSGAIAGGTLGAFVFLSILAGFIVWFGLVRRRRRAAEMHALELHMTKEGETSSVTTNRTAATDSESLLSRLSNIIPVVYIPGVSVLHSETRQGLPSIRNSVRASEYSASTAVVTRLMQLHPNVVDIRRESLLSQQSVKNAPESWREVGDKSLSDQRSTFVSPKGRAVIDCDQVTVQKLPPAPPPSRPASRATIPRRTDAAGPNNRLPTIPSIAGE